MQPTRDNQRWRRLEEIFLAALDRPREEREAYLQEACEGDEGLLEEVRGMLASDEGDDGLLDHPVAVLPGPEQLGQGATEGSKEGSPGITPTRPWSGAIVAPLPPQEVLAGRFRVVRFLAAGGMGEVYQAEDQELGEQVALKTVRGQLAEDPQVMERFRRELQLARRVSHPSVCRCYDIYHHQFPPDSPRGEVIFLTMELLEGETLAERLRREGALSTEEAEPLIRQIAEGLAAAHDTGIVHRDLKSANVMLVPMKRGTRAVITDFGLARPRGGATITQTGLTLGTPAYMAPEQVRGDEITSATDLYALGILIYEMLTGHFPFEAEDSLAMALRRLSEPPTSPRHYVKDLERRWERTILRCLERVPEARFTSARQLLRSLDGESIPLAPGVRRRRLGWALGILLVLGLLVGLGIVGWNQPWAKDDGAAVSDTVGRGTPEAVGSEVRQRSVVAVVGFKNLTGKEDAGWMSTALAEMLNMELASDEWLRTIPGETVARMKLELGIPDQASFARETLDSMQRYLGCDLVIAGSYVATDQGLRFDVRLEDVAAGSVQGITESGSEEELFQLVSRTGRRLRELLGVEPPPELLEEPSLPTSSKAARLYAEGLERLRLFDALGARDRLQAAVTEAPEAPLVHAGLAAAWTALGYDAEAAASARRAFELGDELPRSERMLVEARYHETAGSRGRAVEIYKALYEFFPDDLEHGLRLVRVLYSYGRGKEAAEILDALRRLPSPIGEDPRIDLAEAEVAELLSDYPRALAAARKALERSESLGARWLRARAAYQKGRAYWRLGERGEAEAAVRSAETLFEALGDREGLARALNLRANVVQNEGRSREARSLYEQALAQYRGIGQQAGVSRVLNNLAWVVYQEGEVDRARALYREAIAIARQVESLNDEARSLHNLALLSKQQGDEAGAQTLYGESLELARESGDRGLESLVLNNLARLLQERGFREEALETFEQALEIARETGDAQAEASRLINLGILLRQLGRPTEAAERFRESITIFRRLEDTARLARRLDNLASLELDRGDLAAARRAIREVEGLLPEFATNSSERAVWASVYARLLAAEGDLEGALEHIEESLAERRRQGSEVRILVAEVDRARLLLTLDRAGEAEVQARRARDRLLENDEPTEALVASTVLLRALARGGRAAEAEAEIEVVRRILAEASLIDVEDRLRLETVERELQTYRDPEAAIDGLEDLRLRVEATGLGALAFEVRLALGNALAQAGQGERAQEVLEALGRDAEAAGFREIARRARALGAS